MEGFRERIIRQYSEKRAFNKQAWLLKCVQKKPALRLAYRKILEYLAQHYDYETNQFREANHSTIDRKCRLRKNLAKQYLEELE